MKFSNKKRWQAKLAGTANGGEVFSDRRVSCKLDGQIYGLLIEFYSSLESI